MVLKPLRPLLLWQCLDAIITHPVLASRPQHDLTGPGDLIPITAIPALLTTTTKLLLHALRHLLLVGVVLVLVAIVLVVHVVGVLLRLVLGTLAVVLVHAFCFG